MEEEVLNRIDVGFQNPASTFELASSAEQAHLRRDSSVQIATYSKGTIRAYTPSKSRSVSLPA